MSGDALSDAAKRLLDESGGAGEFGQVVRDPVTGERGLVLAVKGQALDELLAILAQQASARSVEATPPSLWNLVKRSFAEAPQPIAIDGMDN